MKLDYPRLVFTSPGDQACQGGTYGYQLVKDDEELLAAFEAGWFMTIPEALKGEATSISVRIVNDIMAEEKQAAIEKSQELINSSPASTSEEPMAAGGFKLPGA